MRFGEPHWLLLLWVVPVLVSLAVWQVRARRRGLERFADPGLLSAMGVRNRVWKQVLKGALVVCASVLLIVALARPQWNPKERTVTRRGRDVVFLVDVSRSMLARDLVPTRLERTKLWIRDLTGSLRGDRVALVAFAGAASVQCPLTTDYGFFDLALGELGPDSVPRGGTDIGDAIRKCVTTVFNADEDDANNYRDIILFTDGEDQDSFPVAAAEVAGRAGVRIIAIGLGSSGEGSEIVLDDSGQPVRDASGRIVKSRLDSETLTKIARASAGGVYLEVGTGTIDLEQVYSDLVRSAAQTETEEASAVRYDEGYAWFLLAAFVSLCAEGVIRDP